MNYQVLARKWRPQTFEQMVGQQHVIQALINSLNKQRLHHAYLFTGTRGVGKTSIARLLAKALNCEQGISATPCLECETCQAIEKGHFIDLIEIDGASRTKVEDTREILDNVQYTPTQGRFKIYIIDEVHMLSNHSFNALLKTLEEPPEHIKFLLATTDPQKLPVTVLSRCLQFSLKSMNPEQISTHLAHILKEEAITFEDEALTIIAQAANGSIRDSLSLLDQAIAYGNDKIESLSVRQMLGFTQKDYAIPLLQALASQDANAILDINLNLVEEGADFHLVLNDVLGYLHKITLIQCDYKGQITNEALVKLAKQLTPEDTQLFYQIGLKGAQDLMLAPTPSIGFDMVMLRMLAFQPATQTINPPLAHEIKTQTQETTDTSLASPKNPAPSKKTETPKFQIQPEIPMPSVNTEISSPPLQSEAPASPIQSKASMSPIETKAMPNKTLETMNKSKEVATKNHYHPSDELNWDNVVKHLKLTGMAMSVAQNAILVAKSNSSIELGIEPGHQSMLTPTVINRLQEALSDYFQTKITLKTSTQSAVNSPAKKQQAYDESQQKAAEQAIQSDPMVKTLKQTFNAELLPNSIKPKVENE